MFIPVQTLLQGLRARWSEPHRRYHDTTHLQAMLAGMRHVELSSPGMVELAVWYHDAVYVPGSSSNERDSADLLLAECAGVFDEEAIRGAAVLVLATGSHAVPPGLAPSLAADCAAFLDLDLAVLGGSAIDYDRYARGVAEEYAPAVSPEAWRSGRAGFLRGALARPRLFLTDEAHEALGGRARDNLARELAALEAQP